MFYLSLLPSIRTRPSSARGRRDCYDKCSAGCQVPLQHRFSHQESSTGSCQWLVSSLCLWMHSFFSGFLPIFSLFKYSARSSPRYDALCILLRHSKNVRYWFAHNVLFAYPNRFSEYLLECPSAEVRGAFAKLIVFIAHFSLQDGPCPSPTASPGPSAQVGAGLKRSLLGKWLLIGLWGRFHVKQFELLIYLNILKVDCITGCHQQFSSCALYWCNPAVVCLLFSIFVYYQGCDNLSLSDHLLRAVLNLLRREVSEHGRHLQQYFNLFVMYANLGKEHTAITLLSCTSVLLWILQARFMENINDN